MKRLIKRCKSWVAVSGGFLEVKFPPPRIGRRIACAENPCIALSLLVDDLVMESVPDYSDKRLQGNCVFCGTPLGASNTSRDHTPSKVFLNQPYPDNLFVTDSCKSCNNSFSKDEEYAAAVLGAMMSGSADPEKQVWDNAKKILRRHSKLAKSLQDGIRPVEEGGLSEAEKGSIYFTFDHERLENVLVKNAIVIAFYQISERLYDQKPSHVGWATWSSMSDEKRRGFLTIPMPQKVPEVGSRIMNYAVAEDSFGNAFPHNDWFVIQPGIFNFAIMWESAIVVRMIFHDYLAAEVIWDRE